MADHHNMIFRVQFLMRARRDISHWNQLCPVNPRRLILPRLAHIQQLKRRAAFLQRLHLFRRNLKLHSCVPPPRDIARPTRVSRARPIIACVVLSPSPAISNLRRSNPRSSNPEVRIDGRLYGRSSSRRQQASELGMTGKDTSSRVAEKTRFCTCVWVALRFSAAIRALF